MVEAMEELGLVEKIEDLHAGETVELTINREGQTATVMPWLQCFRQPVRDTITLSRRPSSRTRSLKRW